MSWKVCEWWGRFLACSIGSPIPPQALIRCPVRHPLATALVAYIVRRRTARPAPNGGQQYQLITLVPPFPFLRHVARATTLPVSFRLRNFLTRTFHSATRDLTPFDTQFFENHTFLKELDKISCCRSSWWSCMHVCAVILLHFQCDPSQQIRTGITGRVIYIARYALQGSKQGTNRGKIPSYLDEKQVRLICTLRKKGGLQFNSGVDENIQKIQHE